MDIIASEIEHAARLTDIFGRWPDFHDALIDVIRLTSEGPGVEVDIWLFEPNWDAETNSLPRIRHQANTTLRFDGVHDLVLSDFTFQNMISNLVLERFEPREQTPYGSPLRFKVRFEGSVGCDMKFACSSIAVIAAAARAVPHQSG